MQNPNELMSATIAAFTQWRTTRSHPRQTTPTGLRQQAVVLLEHFPAPQVVTKLNINGTNLKRWAEDKNGQNDFITLPDVVQPQSTQLNLELTFGNGCLMRLNGDISPAQLTAITQSVAVQSGVAL